MAKADKYATADSAMRVKVTASDKAVPTPATPKSAGHNRGGQNNNKRKADQMDSCSNNKLVASMEGETSAPQAGPLWKRSNRNNANWLPKQSFEQLLDAPCKIHSGAQPSNHTLRQCSFARRLTQGDGLPAPPDNKQDTGYGATASSVAPPTAPEVVASPSPAAPEAVAPSPSRGIPAPSSPESAYAAPLEAAAISTPWAVSTELPSGS
ncbi:hypothetical protein D1007_55835 [Hordeum vulgare]|nr:hypothetical protein D1007_55835 [Hordeum vulgare]